MKSMSYIKFDRALMTNLKEATDREVMRRNHRGAMMCSTILGCNTRKYHGLLIVPPVRRTASNPRLDPLVLLSSLDETVIQHDAPFNLSVHKYAGEVFSPNGHKYIREFDNEVATRVLYRVGGVILEKEVIFSKDRNQLLIKYKLVEAHSRTTLRLRPLLAFRTIRELTHENSALDWNYTTEDQGISMCLYEGYPRLYMQLSKGGDNMWHEDNLWYKNFFYDKEAERGNPCIEDLPSPGFFEVEIKRGEEIIFSAGDEPISPRDLKSEFAKAYADTLPRSSFRNCLSSAIEQFVFTPPKDEDSREEQKTYLIAGIPWFGARIRDILVSLTACSYGVGHPERYDQVLKSVLPPIWNYLETKEESEPLLKGVRNPDTLLWLINSIQDCYRWEGLEKTRDRYGDVVKRAMDCLFDSEVPMMRLEENGLLYAEPDRLDDPITWMDNTLDGWPVVDRRGYIVEYNALWYNALCFYRQLFSLQDPALDDMIMRTRESFIRTFVNEHDYLFDYVTGGQGSVDWSVRPNQILAVGLTYSPLSRSLQRKVLDIVTKELLTPKGLRTLSPKSPYYKPYLNGSQHDRKYAYLQGGVWPWLIYYYLSAYLKLFQRVGVDFVDRLLIPFEDEIAQHGIGSISEMYDPTPPYRGRGAISFMMSVSALLRIQNRLNEYKSEHSDTIFDYRLSMTTHHKSSPDKDENKDLSDDNGRSIESKKI